MSDLGNKKIMASNIKRLMSKKDVNQKEVCASLNFKESTFSDWVNAKSYPRIDKIEKMADYFVVKKSDLVEDKSKKIDENYLSDEILELAHELSENEELRLFVKAGMKMSRARLIAYTQLFENLCSVEDNNDK